MNIQTISTISPRRLGLAFGLTGVVFYLGCILTMTTAPREQQVLFFNSLLHGIDVETVLRDSVSLMEVALGVVSTFVLAWFAGALVAGFYNIRPRGKR